MIPQLRKSRFSLTAMAVTLALLGGCSSMGMHHGMDVTLTGAQEVPPVATSASATGMFMIESDHSVSGKITTTGIDGTVAHIHMGAPGQNGPVIVPLTKNGDTYSVPDGTKLTDAQYDAYKAGNLYANVRDAIEKKSPLDVTPEQALRTMRAVLLAHKSSREGRTVNWTEAPE